jgi:6-pyruvoyl-tetrahydropterin synthase
MVEEEFRAKALDVFHKVQQDIDPNEFNQQVRQLLKIIEKTPLHKLITFDDLKWAIKDDMFFHWSTTIRNVSDDKFIERFKFTILTTKTYDFYVPIYCLYDFPKNMALANTIVIDFQDLPKEIQDYFISKWQHRFTIDTEYHHTEDEYVNLKKKSTFILLIVKSNGSNKAMEEARDKAEDVFHIIRFVYQINFNLIDIHYIERESGNSGGLEGIAGLPFCGGANYDKLFGKSIKIISKIFSKEEPNDIEKRVKNVVRIFGTQTSITDRQVRFLLLMSCLEGLLMSQYDRDYVLWRLAEKTAFFLGGDRRQTNDYIKNAYRKRSVFIHGSSKKTNPITEDDISKAEQIVGDVVWKLIIEFLNRGYTQIARNRDSKKQVLSVDEYIEQEKFGKPQNAKT